MSEKQKKKTEMDMYRELEALNVPNAISITTNGNMTNIDYKWKSLEQKVAYFMKTYKLAPSDMTIMKGALVIKKSGWLKIAQQNGFEYNRTAIQEANYEQHRFVVKAQLFFKDSDKPIEATGMCERSEPGKEYFTNASLLETAESRSIVRAIIIKCPLAGVDSEEIYEAKEMQEATQFIEQAKKATEELHSKKCPECGSKAFFNGKCRECGITKEELEGQ